MKTRLLIVLLVLLMPTVAWPGAAANPAELSMIAHEARDGDPAAALLYGLAWLEGRYGLKADASKAVVWLRKSAQGGNHYAQLMLGNLYAEGHGVSADPETAVSWWRAAAEAGNSQAQYRLGKAYLDGNGVEHDAKTAMVWLKQAADHGNADAQFMIGKLYHEGYVVAQDQQLARDWLGRAAASGHTEAINLLALIDTFLKSTTLTAQESYSALKERAEQGDPHAQYELGLRYENGAYDVTADPEKALAWFRRAARNGNLLAMKKLSGIYAQGLLGVAKDPEKARYWQQRSAGKR